MNRQSNFIRVIKQFEPEQVGHLLDGLAHIAPDFTDQVIAFAFGDEYARTGLDIRARQISTLSSLVALGAPPEIYRHLQTARSSGVTREEIVDVIMQSAVFAGFPAALNAFAAARMVFEQEAPRASA